MADTNNRGAYKDAEAPGGEDLYGAGGSQVTGGVDVAGGTDDNARAGGADDAQGPDTIPAPADGDTREANASPEKKGG
jgi:hypothetical protein